MAKAIAVKEIGETAEIAEIPQVPIPDFVWVGCSDCWQPQDAARPVRAYSEWLADGMRYRTYQCATCSARNGYHTEIHPTLWAFWLEHARPYLEGGRAAEATEVQRFGV